MSEWDDLADIVERPPLTKPLRGRLNTTIENFRKSNLNHSITNRVGTGTSRRKPVVTLHKVNLPD